MFQGATVTSSAQCVAGIRPFGVCGQVHLLSLVLFDITVTCGGLHQSLSRARVTHTDREHVCIDEAIWGGLKGRMGLISVSSVLRELWQTCGWLVGS